ncbi:MAG: helix-turn-helix transcriptional regulator [Rhodoferax sp.]|nr:helix-turn-helix transcriptional regulator [Rhodoferax sp.]
MNADDLLETIGLQIRRHRKACGLSQEELATRCGMFRTYLSRIEGGTANPTVRVLQSLASVLEIDVAVLFRA